VAAMLLLGHEGFCLLDKPLTEELSGPGLKHTKKFKLIEQTPYLITLKNRARRTAL
jgi:hypothetical protein